MLEVLNHWIAGRKIWVYGFGVEGQSTFKFFTQLGFQVGVIDSNEDLNLEGVETHLGSQAMQRYFENCSGDLIIRSAGISPLKSELRQAVLQGAEVSSQLDIFYRLNHKPVIAVTGTMGKGTTCSMIQYVFEDHQIHSAIGGNFGLAMLDLLSKQDELDVIILELSSFQLMDFKGRFEVSVLLRTTSEHLDWHHDHSEYLTAKSQLISHLSPSDSVIYYQDAPNCELMVESSSPNSQVIPYGSLNPDASIIGDRVNFKFNGEDHSGEFHLDQSQLMGQYQLQNVAAAILAIHSIGCVKVPDAIQSLYSFSGIEMRHQLVATKGGIRFINDSYATRPDASIAAIQSVQEGPLALVLGGSEKHADFEELAEVISQHPTISAIFLIGQTSSRLQKSILNMNSSVHTYVCASFVSALEGALANLKESLEGQSGYGTLLLSPACASFGLFKNYKDRGYQFNAWVEQL